MQLVHVVATDNRFSRKLLTDCHETFSYYKMHFLLTARLSLYIRYRFEVTCVCLPSVVAVCCLVGVAKLSLQYGTTGV